MSYISDLFDLFPFDGLTHRKSQVFAGHPVKTNVKYDKLVVHLKNDYLDKILSI